MSEQLSESEQADLDAAVENEANEQFADDAPPEPPEPDESAGMSEAEIEEAQKTLAREASRHADRVGQIMGEDAQALELCPLCIPNVPGFVYAEFVPDEQRDAVLTLLTGTASSEYEDDPLADECETCKGQGFTTTGSKVLEYLRRPCPACIGMGFMDHTRRAQWNGEQALRNPPQAPTPMIAPYVAPPNGTPDTDQWGRPRGHWLYGKDPRYLSDGERQGDLPHVQAV